MYTPIFNAGNQGSFATDMLIMQDIEKSAPGRFTLYFGYENNWQLIGCYNTEEEAAAGRHQYMKDNNIKSYYMRGWQELDGSQIFDYGSHTTFFKLTIF